MTSPTLSFPVSLLTFGLISLSAQSISAAGIPSDLSSGDRPNFIIYFTDDQGTDMYGFLNGDPAKDFREPDADYYTPSFDRLAAEGAYFSNAYVNASVCAPSRTAIYGGVFPGRGANSTYLSGQYSTDPSETGRAAVYQAVDTNGQVCVNFGTSFGTSHKSLFKMLDNAGYFTGFMGKAGGFAKGANKATYNEFLDVLREHGIDYPVAATQGNMGNSEHHNQEWIGWGAITFLDALMAEEDSEGENIPFFMAINPLVPHRPSPQASLNLTDSVKLRTTQGGVLTQAEYQDVLDAQGYGFDEPYSRAMVNQRAAGYTGADAAPILWVDDTLTSILAKLEDMGELDNTYIIHLSDHGFGGSGAKGDIYQIGINVPMLIRGPGVPAGVEIRAAVSAIDISATIYEAAGITPPTHDAPGDLEFDGLSFLDILHGKESGEDRVAYSEIGYTKVVIKGPWKYIAWRIPTEFLNVAADEGIENPYTDLPHEPTPGVYTNGWYPSNNLPYMNHFTRHGPWSTDFGRGWDDYPHYFDPDQLYNIENDPQEQINYVEDPAYADVLADMQAEMGKFIARLPGSFGEWKNGLRIDTQSASNSNNPRNILGDLDLSGDLDAIGIDNLNNFPTSRINNSSPQVLVTYTGTRIGEYEYKAVWQDKGWDVEYDDANKRVLLVPASFSWWKTQHGLPAGATFDGDANGNGLADGIEYAIDLNAVDSQRSQVDYTLFPNADGSFTSRMEFKQLRHDVSYTATRNNNLNTPWSSDGFTLQPGRFGLMRAKFDSEDDTFFGRIEYELVP